MLFLDTETCGFHGPIVLMQYAKDNGDITLYEPWKRPIWETLNLIECFTAFEICGFNLVFDWFHICRLYTMFKLCDPTWIPEEHISEIKSVESEARFGLCVKPASALDLMLHARKGPFQSLMERKDILVRKVHRTIAPQILKELNKIDLDPMLFARKKVKSDMWQYSDKECSDKNFVDLVLKFKAGGGLKHFAHYILKQKVVNFSEHEVGGRLRPLEYGYAPHKSKWEDVIVHHINFWANNSVGREYANKDIVFTRDLYNYFGCPSTGDDDSILACAVGAIRWHGYPIIEEKINKLKDVALQNQKAAPKAPNPVKEQLLPLLSPVERLALKNKDGNITTRSQVLELISQWRTTEGRPHPAVDFVLKVLKARRAKKEIELYDKLLFAGRFHASFIIIGTLSSRMSGTDKLNPQGIKHSTEVRDCFQLADKGFILCGGDFDGFEISIAEAEYQDEQLRNDLLSGKKFAGLLALEIYPEKSYEDIMASRGSEDDLYDKGKRAGFLLIYGGDENSFENKLAIPKEQGLKILTSFQGKYQGIKRSRQQIHNDFCSMRQPHGIGTKVIWNEPKEYIESLLGFKRYFTLENKICKFLFDLANNVPESWQQYSQKIVRRDRLQTICGAATSAIYAAAFNIQSKNMRAAANHRIQSTGGQITKRLQRKIWDIQPVGVAPFRVLPMNVHDELMCPTKPEYVDEVAAIVNRTVDSFKPVVPLLKMNWKTNLKSWADK